MLFVEKMDNISTLISFGANQRLIFRIFFYEGLLISIKGIISGLILGYMICFIQIYGKLLQMPNTGGDPFPINVSILDTILILILVLILSVLASFLPVKYLLKRGCLRLVKYISSNILFS
jgi:lipoprotein-releasing system permease protein